MIDNLKEPCKECPFRKNSLPGWLGGETPEATYHSVMDAEIDFACHMTRHKTDKNMSRCKGSLLFLKQSCKSPKFNTELSQCVENINRKEISNILLPHEFINHHTIK